MHYNQVVLSQECNMVQHLKMIYAISSTIRIKEGKKSPDHIIDAEKGFDKVQHLSTTNTPTQLGREGWGPPTGGRVIWLLEAFLDISRLCFSEEYSHLDIENSLAMTESWESCGKEISWTVGAGGGKEQEMLTAQMCQIHCKSKKKAKEKKIIKK